MTPDYWDEAKAHLSVVDPLMADLIERYEDPPLRSRGRLFETLVHAIIGQQISAQAAGAVWGRFLQVVGDVEPENILAVSTEELREAGLSGRKVEYIQGLAGDAEWLVSKPWSEMNNEEIQRSLCGLRGIGPWTAEMAMIFSLLRPDVFPLGDIGVVRSIERHYANGARLTHPELEVFAAPWRPYRTVAVWYLWRSLDPEPVEY